MTMLASARSRSLLAVAATASALALALTGCGDASSTDASAGSSPAAGNSTGPGAGMMSGGMSADDESGTDHNAADVMFAQRMIPHHEQAVVMSEEAQTRSQDPVVLDLAKRIKAAQAPEIDRMTSWLGSWGSSMTMSGDDMSGMGHGSDGMMSEEDMIALRAATGADFDRMWIEMMIEHHKGAIDMAEGVLADGSSPDVKSLAEGIAKGQQAEIDEMEAWLSNA